MNQQTLCVLVIEDNPDDVKRIERCLADKNATCASTDSAEKGLNMLIGGTYHLAIVDVELANGESGFEVVRKAHEAGVRTSMMILTNTHCTEQMQTAGYGIGADDYILKSVGNDRLDAILAARFRRMRGESESILVWNDLVLDRPNIKLSRNVGGKLVPLDVTENELRLMKCFMLQPGKMLSVDFLSMDALNYSSPPKTVKNIIYQRINTLRKKLDMTDPCKGIVREKGGDAYALI